MIPAPSNPFAPHADALDLAIAIGASARFGEVPDTGELRRILSLPRRPLDSGEALAEQITRAFRTPWGTMKLRPVQAQLLAEVHQKGGAFAPIAAGQGKTLCSLLAPDFAGAKRPLLIVPAALVEKTKREFRTLAKHWQCLHPDRYTIISYETLSRANASAKLDSQGRIVRPGLLETLRPDLIVFDEVHKVRNKKAAVTRKVTRFLKEHPGIKVVAMSGTLTKRSLRDYSHIARWALGKGSPVPQTDNDLEAWAACLDEKVASFQRVKPGALRLLDPSIDRESVDDENLGKARRAYQSRLVETPGVVATIDGALGTALRISPLDAVQDDAIDEAFKTLRTKWETPDGQDFADALSLYRYARQLSLGIYQIWNPRPPDEWLNARKAWNSACREILKTNRRGLDSELQVIRAVALGLYPEASDALTQWRAVKGQYDPEKNKETRWISDSAVKAAQKWIGEQDAPAIVWCEHTEFARGLARATGMSYYGAGGVDSKGRAIEEHSTEGAGGEAHIIASVQSNGTGRNLQKWSRNLIMSAPPNGAQYEQLLARTHRPGQEDDEVLVSLYLGCWEAIAGIHQARRDCLYTLDTFGSAMRLCYADWLMPEVSEIEARASWRWCK